MYQNSDGSRKEEVAFDIHRVYSAASPAWTRVSPNSSPGALRQSDRRCISWARKRSARDSSFDGQVSSEFINCCSHHCERNRRWIHNDCTNRHNIDQSITLLWPVANMIFPCLIHTRHKPLFLHTAWWASHSTSVPPVRSYTIRSLARRLN
jgi:hypothetical protein